MACVLTSVCVRACTRMWLSMLCMHAIVRRPRAPPSHKVFATYCRHSRGAGDSTTAPTPRTWQPWDEAGGEE